jgi:hypothetical protein
VPMKWMRPCRIRMIEAMIVMIPIFYLLED